MECSQFCRTELRSNPSYVRDDAGHKGRLVLEQINNPQALTSKLLVPTITSVRILEPLELALTPGLEGRPALDPASVARLVRIDDLLAAIPASAMGQ